jgi:ankyrin repeat protein
MSFEFEEDVSSGAVLKLPCFEDMNEHELTQYKLHDVVLITNLLIEAGANVNLPSPDAWHVNRRAKNDPWENMRILLDAGANPNLATSRGNTPLLLACSLKCIKSARILLTYGARPNMEDNIGRTALILAAHDKYPELIELLFEFGADPDRPCTYMTERIGSMCAGVDTCATLFKLERVRRAKLQYNNFRDKMNAFSMGTLPRVSHQTHMGGLSDMMRDISLHIGYISMEDRLLAIDEIAAQELHEYSTTYSHYWDEYDQEIADEMAGWSGSDNESDGSEDGSE